MNTQFGHNESAVRLGILADTAQRALERVASGETDTIEGWLAYGAALNEGRGLFASDEQFGQWKKISVYGNLPDTIFRPEAHEESAAMWGAANRDDFATACVAGNRRTVRGIHAKWMQLDAERKAAEERAKAEAERAKAEAERKIADDARRKAEADRQEAKARADAEAEAIAAVKRAKDAEQRLIAQKQAQAAAKARADAEASAKAEDEKAKASERIAKASDKAAKTADNSAKAAEKKAAKAKGGDTSDAASNHLAIGTGENEWYTPAEFAEMARAVMGGIDLDPASDPEANEVIKATRFFTKDDDGLARDWSGRLWLNPPYSRDLMLPFCEKLAAHVEAGDVTDAILVSHNNTDTRWFQLLGKHCAAISFPKSRIKFYRGEDIAAPVNGQCFFYFGKDAAKFTEIFSEIGLVVFPK